MAIEVQYTCPAGSQKKVAINPALFIHVYLRVHPHSPQYHQSHQQCFCFLTQSSPARRRMSVLNAFSLHKYRLYWFRPNQTFFQGCASIRVTHPLSESGNPKYQQRIICSVLRRTRRRQTIATRESGVRQLWNTRTSTTGELWANVTPLSSSSSKPNTFGDFKLKKRRRDILETQDFGVCVTPFFFKSYLMWELIEKFVSRQPTGPKTL